MTDARTTPSVTTTAQGQSPTSRSKLGLPCHTTVDPAASASASCCKINPPSLHELQARFLESLLPFVGWCSLSNCHQARQRRCADGLSTTSIDRTLLVVLLEVANSVRTVRTHCAPESREHRGSASRKSAMCAKVTGLIEQSAQS